MSFGLVPSTNDHANPAALSVSVNVALAVVHDCKASMGWLGFARKLRGWGFGVVRGGGRNGSAGGNIFLGLPEGGGGSDLQKRFKNP